MHGGGTRGGVWRGVNLDGGRVGGIQRVWKNILVYSKSTEEHEEHL
jgi:hypothetical protein